MIRPGESNQNRWDRVWKFKPINCKAITQLYNRGRSNEALGFHSIFMSQVLRTLRLNFIGTTANHSTINVTSKMNSGSIQTSLRETKDI